MQLEAIEIDVAIAAKFVQLVLNCINQEYPHNNIFWFESDEDIKPPRELMPAFYGCLDWHSAVHGHWLLARLARYFPDAEFQPTARQALTQTLTPEKIQGEITHFNRCPFFECPYGFSWLLQLATELREWDDSQAKEWLAALEPLETLVANNFYHWLEKLELPNRTGAHSQTAFPLGLALDWAQSQKNKDFADLIEDKAQKFYQSDRNYPLHFEPLGYDFVSPCLAEADLMRRILSPTDFANWLTDFLPHLLTEDAVNWLQPVQTTKPNDYLQSHFRGLNLSRAWMLEGIISQLPDNDSRLDTLRSVTVLHRQCGLVDVASDHYSSSHWLGTFVVYLITARGLDRYRNLTWTGLNN
ncbi:DUF2891 domain-containing protein [Nostoc sp. ChiQUE01b]|uniref:DUF2891 domain-containing protein n=1 Tax=Nostoc sp. ChiQUE01b TaxID=3075376 RepID=UPI002AD54D4F|nr:DUF2891 domain-containing protein [Nostoc sp. ChiQUE01b]MDZ8260649.1 DUF2891 domain-containing protein [Nostoc sp. ChiQUE01b]